MVVGCKIDELSEPPSSEHRAWALPYLTGGVQHQQQSSSKDSKDSKQHHPPLIDRNATNPISGRSSTSSIDSAVDNWDALRHLKVTDESASSLPSSRCSLEIDSLSDLFFSSFSLLCCWCCAAVCSGGLTVTDFILN